MKNAFTLFIFLLFTFATKAQLHDAQWVIGPTPMSVIDFRNDTIVNDSILHSGMFNRMTLSSICDENGSLLWFTNGANVWDRDGVILLNGSMISPCAYTAQNQAPGLQIPQATIFLPRPGNNNQYILVHFSADTLNDTRPSKIYYSIIDKNENFGFGDIIEKNKIFLEGNRIRGGGLTACKHANGRDWWIVLPKGSSNTYYKFLFQPDTILGPFIQSIGAQYDLPYDVCHSNFSLDGSQYTTGCSIGDVTVMDFDRCTGEFSNARIIKYTPNPGTTPTGGWPCFSPSGKLLYVCNRLEIAQFDLENLDQDSVMIYLAQQGDFAQTLYMRIAPNGETFVSTWNGGPNYMHIIHQPDKRGDSCLFDYGAYTTFSYNTYTIPNMPNYKLGRLIGSGCDTLPPDGINGITEEDLISIIPNPANNYAYVEVGKPGQYDISLIDNTGKTLDIHTTSQIAIFNTENLPSGSYLISITDTRTPTIVQSKNIAIQH